MAVNTIDYKLTLDTSEIPIQMNNIRSQVSGMMMTGPSNVAGAMMGFQQFAGAAGGAYQSMRGGLDRMVDPYIQANQPNYGVIQAQSNLMNELRAVVGGPSAVSDLTPPGVGAAEFSEVLQRSFGQRVADVKAGFLRGAAPVVGGMAGGWLAGAAAGAAFGPIGSIVGGLAGWTLGEKATAAGLERGDRVFAEMSQLGEIATAGRGFSAGERLQFGRGFRDIATRMGIQMNEMGDIAAGIRGMGMMPRTRDVQESLRQFEGMAQDIREIAVGMQTSLGRATQYLRDVERMGLGRGAGGVFAAAETASGLGTTLGGLISYVGQGRAVGMQAGIGAAAGGGLFLESAFAGARGMGALTGEERLMAGGALGLGRAMGVQALQNAMGPMGQMQLMAMMGQGGAMALPGDMGGMISQAAGNIFGAGDPIANLVEFTTNRNRMLSQVGGRGIRMMQAQSIQAEAQMLMGLSPNLTQERALQFVSMNRGMSEAAARGMARFIGRGFRDASGMGGGGGLLQGGPAAQAMQVRAAWDIAARTPGEPGIIDRLASPFRWVGQQWTNFRVGLAESAERSRKANMLARGFGTPEGRDVKSALHSLRTGSGLLSDMRLNVHDFGAGSLHAQTVLSFGGSEGSVAKPHGPGVLVGGRTLSMEEASKTFNGLSAAISQDRAGRYSSAEWETIRNATASLNRASAKGEFDLKATSEKIRAGIRSISKGSRGSGSTELNEGVRDLVRAADPELARRMDVEGLEGSTGAMVFKLIRRATGEDLGRALTRSGTMMTAGAALAVGSLRSDALLRLAGHGGVLPESRPPSPDPSSPTYTEDLQRYSKWLTQFRETGGARRSLNKDQSGVVKIARPLAKSRTFRNLVSAIEFARKKHSNNIEDIRADERVVRARDLFLNSKDKVLKADQRKIAEAMAKNAISQPELTKAVTRMTTLTAKAKSKPGATVDREGPPGMTQSFATQSESFQSQVATSLRKTAHTLEEVRKSMSAMTARIKSKGR